MLPLFSAGGGIFFLKKKENPNLYKIVSEKNQV